jgi:hypothetical protein
MVAPTREPPTGTARHRCFSQLSTPAVAGQDQLRRRLNRKRFCKFLQSVGPPELGLLRVKRAGRGLWWGPFRR